MSTITQRVPYYAMFSPKASYSIRRLLNTKKKATAMYCGSLFNKIYFLETLTEYVRPIWSSIHNNALPF